MNSGASGQVKPAPSLPCWQLSGGSFSQAETNVVIEKELAIYVNGAHLVTALITPGLEREFVTGYLFSQGFVNAFEELASVEIAEKVVRVTLKDSAKFSPEIARASYRIVSGGGRIAYGDDTSFHKVPTSIKIKKQNIFKAMNTLFEKAEIYRATEGVHAAGLFTPEASPLCIVEDIGRHNTLDKLIGYCLINGIDFNQLVLVSTGRMASEMVAKIGRAGIPVAATKTAVTDKGLEIGSRCGLTIIGFVRDAGTRINTDMEVRIVNEPVMKIYSRPERIIWE